MQEQGIKIEESNMSMLSRSIRRRSGVGVSLFIVAALAAPALAINTSSEFVNPFNKFMSPSGGVDLYSGIASFSHTLMEFPARGDINHDLSLSYSSNVFLNARAKNDRAPSGWVGLGWRLGFGSIVSDHKSTKTHADDDFFWVSPNGVSKKILKKRNEFGHETYHIEDEPYIRIGPRDFNSDGVYDGWTVILANGVFLRYGDLDFSDNRSATRWTLSQGNYVGVVHSGTVNKYPYQWDLAQKSNSGRDAANFYYWQQTSQLKDNTSGTQWSSVEAYTQASYLNKISTTDGNIIEFILNNEAIDAAGSGEYFIPYQSSAGVEDQGYFNVYERRFLASIKVSKKSGETTELVRQFDLKYQKINQSIPGSFVKRLLKTITENGSDSKIQITRFNYLAEISKADDDTYNYGALESVESPLGGKTEFKYSRMNIESGRISQGTLAQYQQYSADHNFNRDGNPYLIVQRITDLVGYFTLYQWTGTQWVTQPDLVDRSFDNSELIITTGKNHFHVTTKYTSAKGYSEWAWDWNGKKWIVSKAKIGENPPFDISGDNLINAVDGKDPYYQFKQKVILADDYFVLIYTNTQQSTPTWRRYAQVFCWNGQYWQAENDAQPINYDEVPTEEIGYAMPNYAILSVNRRVTVLMREQGWQPTPFRIGATIYDPTPIWDANNPQLRITGTKLGESNDRRKIPFCGKDYFVLSLFSSFSNSFNPGYLIFQWNGSQWVAHEDAWINSYASNVITRDDFCIVWGGSNESFGGIAPPLTVYSRNNFEWKIADYQENGITRPFSTGFNDFNRYIQTTPDGKTIVIVHSERNTNGALYWPPYFVRMYRYNSATSCWDAVPLPTDASGTTTTQTGTDFDVAPYGMYVGQTHSKYGFDDRLAAFVIKDHVAFTSGRSRFILNWNGHEWQYDAPMSGERFTRSDFTSDAAYNNFKVIALDGGDDFLAFRPQAGTWDANWGGPWGHRPPNDDADFRMYDALFFYIHNGQQWVSKGRNDFGDPGYFKTGHIFGKYMITFGGPGFKKIWSTYKYQDDFTSSTFYTYPVTTKILDPVVPGSKKVATTFAYNTLMAKIDASSGSAKFNKVASIIPNNGKAATYFFNGMTSDQSAYTGNTDDYLLMDGNVYKHEMFSQANSVIEAKAMVAERKFYEVAQAPSPPNFWPQGIVDRRLIRSVTDSLGVSKEVLYSSFDSNNGIPELVQETNSDGTKKYTKTTFAYKKFSGMGLSGASMLTQTGETTVYEKASGDNTPLSAADVRAATATTWSQHLGNLAWMPNYTFAWDDDKGGYGEFVFPGATNPPVDPSASNPNWHRIKSVEKVSLSGDSLETKNANDVLATTVYRSDVHLPIGQIIDAGFSESSVFTCDYDRNELSPGYFSYFDKENGWEKSHATVVEGPANRLHYGERVLKIENGEGAMRNFKLRANIEYEASAWVYVESGSGDGLYLTAEIRKGTAPSDAWPHKWPALPPIVSLATSEKLTTTGGIWKQLKLNIPAQSDPGSGKEIWVRLTIGRYGETFIAYVDDIRFHPKKALATTRYYDKKSRLSVLTVGADGNPGPRVAYDDFDRPVQWFNVDKTNLANRKLMKAKEYHLINEVAFLENVKVIHPNGGEIFKPGQEVWIEWMNKDMGSIAISYQNADGSGNQPIAVLANQQGFGTYPWTIPAAAVGSRVVKVENTTVPQSDVSDAAFSVSNPPNLPSLPNPANGATGIDWQTQLNLTWSGGDPDGDLIGYDVYFGETNPPTAKMGTASTGTFPITGLQRQKIYYWRVIARDPVSSVSGPVWSFRTSSEPNSPPYFIDVSNSKQALNLPNHWRITLKWTGVDPDGDYIQSYHLKIFASANPDGSVCSHPHIPQFSGESGQPREYTFDLEYANSLCQTWEWEAEAKDLSGATSGWKDMGSFIITNHPGQP